MKARGYSPSGFFCSRRGDPMVCQGAVARTESSASWATGRPSPTDCPSRGGNPVGAGLAPPAPDIVAATGTGRDKPVPYGLPVAWRKPRRGGVCPRPHRTLSLRRERDGTSPCLRPVSQRLLDAASIPHCMWSELGRVHGRGFVKASTAKSAGLLETTECHLGIVLVVDTCWRRRGLRVETRSPESVHRQHRHGQVVRKEPLVVGAMLVAMGEELRRKPIRAANVLRRHIG